MPPDNTVIAVKDITAALENLNNADSMALSERYAEIEILDGVAVSYTHMLLTEYLDTPRQKKQRETRLWDGTYGYWSELATAYVRCVQRYAEDPGNAEDFRDKVTVALARALRRQMQWTRIRYMTPPADLWVRLADLYFFVETSDVDEEVEIFSGETTSMKREFLKSLMQSSLSCENFQPRGQDLAVVVFSQFAGMFVISKVATSEHTHWFDLRHPMAPARTTRTPGPGADARYFGAGLAVSALEKTLKQLEMTRQLPAWLKAAGKVDPVLFRSVVRHVSRDWRGKTQARRNERRKHTARLNVVPGFQGILQRLGIVGGDSLDFTSLPNAESWIIEDVIEGGYGVVIPIVAGGWVEVGSLVSVEDQATHHWQVGVVRRVTLIQGGQQSVGIQLLSRHATTVQIQLEGQSAPADGDTAGNAILLSADAADQREVELLVERGLVVGLQNVRMRDGAYQLVLRPKTILERNAAYVYAAFSVVEVFGHA